MAAEDDWPVVVGNLRKVRKSWARLERTLGREGANPRVSGIFFKAVVHVVLLFVLEMWVLIPCMKQALESFQHGVTKWITGRQPKRRGGYPLLVAAMEELGFEDIGAYILKRHNTVAQYIATRPIMYLCKKTVQRPGA